MTERAGLDVLDDTAHSLFADVDNDGDEDLVLSTGTKPLLFGGTLPVPDAFRFQRPLQGVLTSIAMADYDRDGFLDLYLCVYSYFFGAGEDKAGTPAPYHDARNGRRVCCPERWPWAVRRRDRRSRSRRRERPLSLCGGLGGLRRRRLAGPARRQRFRHENLYRNLGRRDG